MSKERIQSLLKQLCVNLYEREEVMALTLLSAIAGESIFLLGKPGVAKSLIARKLKYAFKDAKSFEYLMNRFSTPDEIFGPVSISKLKDHDKYERITENYLPKSDIVFLDEIWKASPSIQNTLLTVLNEKVYKNGEKEEKLPLKAIISASNELPEPNQGLSALWDRFILRFIVEGISDKDNFFKMIAEDVDINHDPVNLDLKISSEDYKNWQESIKKVAIPKEVFDVILYIKTSIDKQNEKKSKESEEIYISDRRWKKAIKILKTSAFLNGRSEVDLMDCFLLKHILWDMPEQIEFFEELIATAVKEYGYKEQVNLSEYEKLISKYEEEINHELIVQSVIEKVSNSEYVYNGQKYLVLEKEISTNIGSNNSSFSSMINTVNRAFNKNPIDYKYIINNALYDESFSNYVHVLDLKTNQWLKPQKGMNYKVNLLNNYSQNILSNVEIQIADDGLKADATITTRQPNKQLINIWDAQLNEYKNKLNNEIDKLNSFKNKKINNNIFVENEKKQLVEYNIKTIEKEVSNLKNKIQEIEYNYNHISPKTEQIEFKIKKSSIDKYNSIKNMDENLTKMFVYKLIKDGYSEFNDLKYKSKLNHKDIKRIFETVYKD